MSEVLNALYDFETNVLEQVNNRDFVKFSFNDLNFTNNSIMYNDTVLDKKNLSNILKSLKVRDNFLDYKNSLNETDWNSIQNTLTNANKDVEFWAKTKKKTNEIQNIIPKSKIKTDADSKITFNVFFDILNKSVENLDLDTLKIKDLYFDQDEEIVNIKFIEDLDIDVFSNKSDIWKTGKSLQFSLSEFNMMPYLERLMCSNGTLVESKAGYATNINRATFSYNNIEKRINKFLSKDNKLDYMLLDNIHHLKRNEISVNEFEDFRRFFSLRDEISEVVLNEVLDDSYLFKAYGLDIYGQSKKWK